MEPTPEQQQAIDRITLRYDHAPRMTAEQREYFIKVETARIMNPEHQGTVDSHSKEPTR